MEGGQILWSNFGSETHEHAEKNEEAHCRDTESTHPLIANLVAHDLVSAWELPRRK